MPAATGGLREAVEAAEELEQGGVVGADERADLPAAMQDRPARSVQGAVHEQGLRGRAAHAGGERGVPGGGERRGARPRAQAIALSRLMPTAVAACTDRFEKRIAMMARYRSAVQPSRRARRGTGSKPGAPAAGGAAGAVGKSAGSVIGKYGT